MSVLRAWARALGGDLVGSQILCPGPGHGPRDRSLSVRISATAPEGFLAFSHAGDDFPTCRDYVKARLGIDRAPRENRPQTPRSPAPPPPGDDDRTGPALALWRASVPRAPLVERYLTARGLELGDDIAGEVLRWNARIGAMIGLFRNVETDEPQAVSRTYLDAEGRKLERKFLGPVGGAAIKLDDDSEVLGGLHVAEGSRQPCRRECSASSRHGRSAARAPSRPSQF